MSSAEWTRIGLECLACVSGAVLAEAARPSQTWRGSVVSVALGVAGGSYGPQGVEVYFERAKRAHLLVTFVCGLLGAVIFKKLLDGAAAAQPGDVWSAFGRAVDAFRRKPGGAGSNG